MITTINEFRKINEYNVEMPKKMELTYVRTDDNGNFIYKDINGDMYQDVEGVIHDVTDQGEPLAPVHNVVVKKGDPIYNPEDRFGRNPGSKVAESVIKENINTDGLKLFNDACEKFDFYGAFDIAQEEGLFGGDFDEYIESRKNMGNAFDKLIELHTEYQKVAFQLKDYIQSDMEQAQNNYGYPGSDSDDSDDNDDNDNTNNNNGPDDYEKTRGLRGNY